MFALAAVLAGGLVALACTETTVVPPDSESQSGISVNGSGSVFGEPDVAVLTLGVEAQAESVGEARNEAAETMDAVTGALREGGVAEEDIQTTYFSVQPRYNFVEGEQELIGFFVENIVTVKIRNIDDTGTLIDSAVDAGGDETRIDNLTFTIDDPTVLEDEARQLAMDDARARAETLAEAGGVDLGEPQSISESGGARPIAFDGAELAAAQDEAPATTIESGELEVVIDVQVQYAID